MKFHFTSSISEEAINAEKMLIDNYSQNTPQDADVIIMCYRDEYYTKEASTEKGMAIYSGNNDDKPPTDVFENPSVNANMVFDRITYPKADNNYQPTGLTLEYMAIQDLINSLVPMIIADPGETGDPGSKGHL